MKYIWLALGTLLTPIILLLAVGYLLYRPGPPPAARQSLDRYLSIHNRATSQPEHVQSMLHSLRPGAFTVRMSHATYSDSWYFGTTYGAGGLASDATSRPAPFPPTDLWCVAIGGSSGPPRTVLLAEHEDMYVAAWLVHEPVSETDAAYLCR